MNELFSLKENQSKGNNLKYKRESIYGRYTQPFLSLCSSTVMIFNKFLNEVFELLAKLKFFLTDYDNTTSDYNMCTSTFFFEK